MTNSIDDTVARLLLESGVSFSAIFRGEKKNALGGTHPMDKWECRFSCGLRAEEFEFYTGVGLRAEPTEMDKTRARISFPGLSAKDIQNRTIYGRRYLAEIEKARKPKAPTAASVLHSLMRDSSAASQSFDSWCSEYGYDTDSRKAYATYEACQRNADKLRRVIPPGLLWSDLEIALQYY
jgi:hypothetical protein